MWLEGKRQQTSWWRDEMEGMDDKGHRLSMQRICPGCISSSLQAVTITALNQSRQGQYTLSKSKEQFYISNLFNRQVSQGALPGQTSSVWAYYAFSTHHWRNEALKSFRCKSESYGLLLWTQLWEFEWWRQGNSQELAFRSFSFTLIRSFWLPLIGCLLWPCVCLTAPPSPSAYFINISLFKMRC